jgi:hypothetical protein
LWEFWDLSPKKDSINRNELDMYKRFVSTLHVLNIVFQSFLNLLTPMGLGALISYLLTEYVGCPSWIWAVLLMLGTFTGLFSMVKFILSATKALDRLESEQKAREKSQKESAEDTTKAQNDEGFSKNEE